jgi:pyruvate dehydrogenase E2 component (dihydrolipoamide acetyltransferase)
MRCCARWLTVHDFRMPSLGADMEAGTLTEWMVKPGDAVARGQVVAVVETDKGAIEIEIWDSGVVDRIVVAPGGKVPVGEVLALVRAPDEAPSAAPTVSAAAAVQSPVAPASPSVVPPPRSSAPVPAVASGARLKISPSARRLAAELGIDPATAHASGPEGAVTREDIERAAAQRSSPPAKTAVPREPEGWQVQMRRAIAAAMARSKREIPHYYLATDIDVGTLLDWLAAHNLQRGVADRLLPVVPMMKAVAQALNDVPELNGFWRNDRFEAAEQVHLGMAIAMRGGGLVAPAIHDTANRSLDELMSALRDLITRVRGGRLRSSELADPTVTLTSLGDQGVEQVFGVIYPPQVAIVGLGRMVERPRVENGAVVARRVITATLAADHRASDGHRGGLFLASLARRLQKPEALQ